MNNTTETEVKHKEINSKVWYLLILPVLLLSILVFAYFFMSEESIEQEQEFEEEVPIEVTTERKLEGEIYLTLSPLGGVDEPNLYRLDIASSELEPIFEEEEGIRNYMASFSSDLDNMVFVRSYEDDSSQILILDKQTQEITEVTSRSEFFLRNPSFSPDGEKILYWTYENEENPWGVGVQAEENSIYISTIDGTQEKIAQGVYPFFTPTGDSIIFIKNDGLYSFDLENKSEELMINLFTAESPISLPDRDLWGWGGLRAAYSQSDEALIITDYVNEKIHLFDVNSLSPFSYTEMISYDVNKPNWPTFAPLGGYFLIQEYELIQDSSNPILSFFLLEEGEPERVHTFRINNYEVGYIWAADWVVR